MIDRVAAGEHLTVTRSGRAVAELRPLAGRRMSAGALLRRWSKLPRLDWSRARHDLDAVVDART